MTKGELVQLMEMLTDEAIVLTPDERSQQFVPAQARIATKGLQVVLVIEPEIGTND